MNLIVETEKLTDPLQSFLSNIDALAGSEKVRIEGGKEMLACLFFLLTTSAMRSDV
jgi:hypothetical protein